VEDSGTLLLWLPASEMLCSAGRQYRPLPATPAPRGWSISRFPSWNDSKGGMSAAVAKQAEFFFYQRTKRETLIITWLRPLCSAPSPRRSCSCCCLMASHRCIFSCFLSRNALVTSARRTARLRPATKSDAIKNEPPAVSVRS
jgi:hypothetical protein